MTRLIVQEPKDGNSFVSIDGSGKSGILGISRCARNDRSLHAVISLPFQVSLAMTLKGYIRV